MSGRALLRELRDRGLEVKTDGDTVRVRGPRDVLTPAMQETLRESKVDLVAALRREAVERVLDLVPVDPKTGLPDLPRDEPATARQVRRLRQLAAHPVWGEDRATVEEWVEEVLEDGISQFTAYGLIGELGRRIDDRRRKGGRG